MPRTDRSRSLAPYAPRPGAAPYHHRAPSIEHQKMAIFPPRQPPPRIKLPPSPSPHSLKQSSQRPCRGGFSWARSLSLPVRITFYAVLIYDFGEKEHCFMPIRRWFDAQTSGLFTLSDRERAAVDPRVRATPLPGAVERDNMVKPDQRTPIEYFKERENER
ncbi:hypothetical protein MVLG_02520 [Microbotryum lychnidis-dioicae p1A1 Lamole]|uniref:Uncharacterized protein n=1 Tax=Microbotryum lychnidis-dioicae (strain p1A1 Lamole / MvSl-1064) TaxID=683840 RepID=U5H5E6_USTV1|nr:hypothetical protein MVLG_02520 [Microbotryum lychnidis-dioicae p1A1 Lamole]|eukprot:KDE07114.1 hypothetical protein MVLG_02520 [Microbotryum lychnidis-dioicae p1A1 Lamole]